MFLKLTLSSITVPAIFQYTGKNNPFIFPLVSVPHFLSHSDSLLHTAENLWHINHCCINHTSLAPLPRPHIGLAKPQSWQLKVSGEIHIIVLNSTIIFIIMIIQLTPPQHSGFIHFSTLLEGYFLLSLLFSIFQNHLLFHGKGNKKRITTNSSPPAYSHLILYALPTFFLQMYCLPFPLLS